MARTTLDHIFALQDKRAYVTNAHYSRKVSRKWSR